MAAAWCARWVLQRGEVGFLSWVRRAACARVPLFLCLTERHEGNTEAIAACNQRPSNLQRRCSRMLVKYGLTSDVGGEASRRRWIYTMLPLLC